MRVHLISEWEANQPPSMYACFHATCKGVALECADMKRCNQATSDKEDKGTLAWEQ
jgi:hypothetical protein